jgi:hypothetical protein
MTTFIPNPAFRPEISRTKRFRAGMGEITVGVAEEIRLAAEVFRDTGNFIRRVGVRGNRIELERHFAHIIEMGSRNNPPQRNALRGAVAAGLRYEDPRGAE